MLVVDPSLSTWAAKGPDRLLLRALDVGSARVISSVLAKSAALDFYRRCGRCIAQQSGVRHFREAHGGQIWDRGGCRST